MHIKEAASADTVRGATELGTGELELESSDCEFNPVGAITRSAGSFRVAGVVQHEEARRAGT